MKGARSPRERILEATISLLIETREPSALTMRAVARRARVGIGLANYHFGGKETLVRQAVRAFIGRSVVAGYGNKPPSGATLREMLVSLLRRPMDFLTAYPKLSRISVLYDLSSPAEGDNSDETFREIDAALERIFSDSQLPVDLKTGIWISLGAIHEAFLRPERFRHRTGLDFFSKEGKEAFVSQLASFVLGEHPAAGAHAHDET